MSVLSLTNKSTAPKTSNCSFKYIALWVVQLLTWNVGTRPSNSSTSLSAPTLFKPTPTINPLPEWKYPAWFVVGMWNRLLCWGLYTHIKKKTPRGTTPDLNATPSHLFPSSTPISSPPFPQRGSVTFPLVGIFFNRNQMLVVLLRSP